MNKSLLEVIIAIILVMIVVGAQASTNLPSRKALVITKSAQTEASPISLPSQLVVYYFHGNARCPSCYKLEQYAREAVEQNFPEEIKSGKIVFKRINTEQAGNDHFVYDYQLYTKSVVISLVKDGKQVRYKNLERVWDLLKDQNKYHDYIRDEIKPFLGEV